MLEKIISGGQTGVDRAALDAALEAHFPCGGWCPAARQAEDGRIPDHYPLVELPGAGYQERTLKNIMDAQGTAIVYFGDLEGGTAVTAYFCMKKGKPYKLIDGEEISVERAVVLLSDFIEEKAIRVLNVAGPRASRNPLAYGYTRAVVEGVLRGSGR
jgi:hypothetical protein